MTDTSSAASHSPNENARRVMDALHKSAQRARRIAAQTGTKLVVVRDGKLITESVPRDEQAER